MSPSDHEDGLDQPGPLDPWPPADAPLASGHDRYAGRTPTVQRRVDRRRPVVAKGGGGTEAAVRRSTEARGRARRDGHPRLLAVAVLLSVAVVFALAGVAGGLGADSGGSGAATVPFSLLPLTPEYLKEGAATSTTAYPGSALDEAGTGSSAADAPDTTDTLSDTSDTTTSDGA